MKKIIGIFVVLMGIGAFFIIYDFSSKEDQTSILQRVVVEEKTVETEESPPSKEVAFKNETRHKAGDLSGMFEKRFKFNLESAGISKDLQSEILYVCYPGFFNDEDIEKFEDQLDQRIKNNPGKVYEEITEFITNYRNKIPTKVKGLLFMKLAGIKGYEGKVRELSLNELEKFTDGSVLPANKMDKPQETLVDAVSNIYETYLHTSKGKESEIQSDTFKILEIQNHEKIRESIIATYVEVDPINSMNLLKVLKTQGELSPMLEAYLNKF